MGIKIKETYDIITEESAIYGEFAESGFIDEEGTEYTFNELVELLKNCHTNTTHYDTITWATHPAYNDGTVDYYQGDTENRSYHPVSNRDKRYFRLACVAAGIATKN